MTTTPEKIAMLRRLHADSTMVAGPHYRKAACEELPGLMDDLEAAQAQVKVLREALERVAWYCRESADITGLRTCVVDIARVALAKTEVQP